MSGDGDRGVALRSPAWRATLHPRLHSAAPPGLVETKNRTARHSLISENRRLTASVQLRPMAALGIWCLCGTKSRDSSNHDDATGTTNREEVQQVVCTVPNWITRVLR